VVGFCFILNLSNSYAQEKSDTKRSKAILLMNEGKFKEALSVLESIKTSVNPPDYLFMLGVAYQKNSRYSESVEALKQYASIRPNDEDHHYYLGYALYNLKQYDASLDEFNKSVLLGVKTEAASYYSGLIYFDKKDYASALPFFIKASTNSGEYENVSHYYAGICLYKDGISEGGPDSLEAALYHFDKVIKDNSDIDKDSRKYIAIIKEYLDTGAIRQKDRLELKFRAELFYTTNRTSDPIDGVPVIGYDANKSGFGGDFLFDIGVAPVLMNNFALFINYGFHENMGFSSQVNMSNTQKHTPGISFLFFNEARSMEGRLDYNYELNYVDADKVRKIDFAHAIVPSYLNSFSNNWAFGIKLPFRLHNGNNGAWGDFSAKSFEVVLMSYHFFGKTSIRLEPYILFFMPSSTSNLTKFKYYCFSAKMNLPWKLIFVWPSLKLAPGRIARSVGDSNTVYDFGISFFRPLGLGSRIELVGTARKGYVSNNWEIISGFAFEYVY